MSVPSHVPQSQINAMMAAAEKKMQQDGIEIHPQESVTQYEKVVEYEQINEPEEIIQSEDDDHKNTVVEESIIAPKLTRQEEGFASIRAARAKAERERDELKQLLEEQQRYNRKSHEKEEPQSQEDDFDMDDESLIEGKHFKKMAHEIKQLKKTVQSYQQQTGQVAQQTIDMKLRSQFPDIDKVLSPDNIAMFSELEPDLAESIANNQDVFKKASLAYKMIKQYGIYKEDNYTQEKIMAKTNSLKPKPLASVSPQQGESPMSKANAFANGLTPELKAQLHKEMIQAMKGL